MSAFCLCEGNHGEMWIGGIGTISRVKDGIATHFDVPVGEKVGLNFDQSDLPRVVSLAYSQEGMLWVGTSLGLFRFDEGSEVFDPVGGHPNLNTGVYGIAFGRDRSVWLVTKKSLVQFASDGDAREFELVMDDRVLEPKHVVVGAGGGVWCSTTRGVFALDGDGSGFVVAIPQGGASKPDSASIQVERRPLPVVILFSGTGKSLAPRLRVHEREGIYAIGSGETYYCRMGRVPVRCGKGETADHRAVGLRRPIVWAQRNEMDLLAYDPREGLEHVIKLPARLKSYLLADVIASRSGSVWIASRNGVFVGSKYLSGTRWYPAVIKDGLMSVRFPRGNMAVELADGTIYTCLGGTAIQSISSQGERTPDFRALDADTKVASLRLDADDNLWIATGSGIYRMLGDGPLIKLIDAKEVKDVLILGGTLWFTDEYGLKRVSLTGSVDRLPEPESILCASGVTAKGRSFSALTHTHGRIWIVAGLSGILSTSITSPLIEHLECNSNLHAAHKVGAIDLVARGKEILSLYANRLISYDTETDAMKSLHEGYRIGNIAFQRLALDRHGALWMASSKGLWRLDGDGKRSWLVVNSSRIVDRYWSRMSLGGSGSILIGTKSGLLVVDPDRVGRSGAVRPMIEGLLVGGAVLDHRRIEDLEIRSDTDDVVVHLGTAGGFNRNGSKFRVEIRDAVAVRHRFVTGPRLSLPRLAVGGYDISVQVGDRDWGWSTSADLLKLRVLPPVGRGFSRLLLGGLAVLVIGVISVSWWLRHRVVDKRFREREALLHARHKEKEERVRSVAHDLRGPLTAVENLTEVLKIRARDDHLDTEKHLALLDQVQTGIRRIDDIVEELGVPLQAGEARGTEVAPCLDALTDALCVMARAKNQIVRMDLDCTVGVHVPSHDLERIVQNLVHNATKFAPVESVIEVEVRNTGERALIRVLDRGPGVSSEMKGSVIPFTQSDSSEFSAENSGRPSGLGHWMIRNIVDKHNGKFWCENREGGGASFSVSLPIVGSSR